MRSGGYGAGRSTGWAGSTLFGGVTLLSDIGMGMGETTTAVLESKGIDGKSVKGGMKESK